MPGVSIKAIIAALLVAFGLGHASAPPPPDRLGLPGLMLWSWDHADDLRFIDPADTGVAYLAGSIRLAAEGIVVTPRHNPLLLTAGATTLAVIHVAIGREPPTLDDAARDRLVAALLSLRPVTATALQIDFEVTRSQQSFLAATILALRRELPETPLSMTALSAWCLNEHWLDSLPVDEVVPMLFRLGPDRLRIAAHFSAGGDFRATHCRGSFGIATDEALRAGFAAPRLAGRRAYVFTPKRWTAATYATIRREIAR
jgi:hypothetical protein